jgi:hypothetical protein
MPEAPVISPWLLTFQLESTASAGDFISRRAQSATPSIAADPTILQFEGALAHRLPPYPIVFRRPDDSSIEEFQ